MTDELDDEQRERDTLDDARDKYAEQLKTRLDSGEKLDAHELSFLEAVQSQTVDEFPERLHVAHPKPPRSPAQIAQAQKNLERINSEKLQTGPKTPEGKERSAQNAIKHSLYAQSYMSLFKPCFTTCSEYPCSLVAEGRTEPGDKCLDKQHFVEALSAIELAMKHKKFDALEDVVAIELASTLDMIRKLKEQVVSIGVLVKSIKKTSVTKDDSTTDTEHIEYKLNPALLALPKLIEGFGLTLPDAMLTPRERARHKIAEKEVETMAERTARAGRRFLNSFKKDKSE